MNETPDPAVVRDFIDQVASQTPDEHTVAQGGSPDTAYVVTPCRGPDPVGGVYLTEREATRAAYAIAGYGSYVDDVLASGRTVRAWTSGDVLAATIRVVPLHAPSHGLPVVDEAAVTAALDGDFAGDDGLPIGCGGGIGPVLDEAESARAAQDGGAA